MARPEAESLQAAVRLVVESGNCSGCGVCTLLDARLRMELDDAGFNRPTFTDGARTDKDGTEADIVRIFGQVCPGRTVRAGSGDRDPLFGPVVSIWQAWASDETQRHAGSSGGAITALTSWLLQSGSVDTVVAARADPLRPAVSAPVTVSNGGEILSLSGSRYGPVSIGANRDVLRPGAAVVAKPCESSALRALSRETGRAAAPLHISFFCAGVPSQLSTDALVASLGLDVTHLRALRYRGDGWPGFFTATDDTGAVRTATYQESWGQWLGPTTQWRCKICVDGVGESADIAAGDYWHTDEGGYPDFTEAAGVSVVIARTRRGHDVLIEAISTGALEARPVDVRTLYPLQPLQTHRRRTLLGRLIGVRAAGRQTPRYVGFGLTALALRNPVKTIRAGIGSFLRATGRCARRRTRTGSQRRR